MMNIIFKPSLQHIAVVKIVATVWMQNDMNDIIDLISINSTTLDKKWNETENELIKKVKMLPLPEVLAGEIIGLITPMGKEIRHWLQYHGSFVSWLTMKKSIHKLCWTSQGVVDKKKTVEVCIRDKVLDGFEQYELACMYCLENDIPKLFDQLPCYDKEYLFVEYPVIPTKSKLVVHWTARLKGASWANERKPKYFLYQYAFIHAANEGNIVATAYFLEKLPPEEKNWYLGKATTECVEQFISKWSSNVVSEKYFAETSCFLLSQMNKEQQMQVFNNCPFWNSTVCLGLPKKKFLFENWNVFVRFSL